MARKRSGDDERDPTSGGKIAPGGKVDPRALQPAALVQETGDDLQADTGEGDDDGIRRVTFTLTRDLNKRLDKYLTDRIAFMSRTQLARLVEMGEVTVNGRAPKPSTKLRLGDVVMVAVPPPPVREIQPEDIPLEVLYEDAHLVVLNKRPDIIVHPARTHQSGTMLNALAYHFQHRSPVGGGLSGVGDEFARPGVAHRLDRDTTGVIVFAKDDEAHWRLGWQFEKRQVEKRYLAVVEGDMPSDADVIDLPIGPSPSKVKGMREKMTVRHDELGKNAVTIYRVRERYEEFTLVELELKTGRTHQIRVHLSYLGCPIVGDDMYGGSNATLGRIARHDSAEMVMSRQALHAATLGFTHPIREEPMVFTAPVPRDMARLIHLLREHRSKGRAISLPGATVDLVQAVPPVS